MKWNEIVTNAETIKKTMEKNKKLASIKGYNFAELLYVFCKAVQNPGKSQAYKKVSKPKNPLGGDFNKNITKNGYIVLAKRTVAYIDKEGVCPNYIKYDDTLKIRPRLLVYALAKVIVYYDTHKNTLPKTCWFKTSDVVKTAKTSNTKKETTTKNTTTKTTTKTGCTNPYKAVPFDDDTGCDSMGQNTPYYCACSMVQKMMYRLGYKDISQSELARVMGTTTDGTGHDGIETGIAYCGRKFGVKFKVQWYNFSDLGWKGMGELMCRENTSVGNHVLYRDQWGHYEYPLTVNTSEGTMKVINSLGDYCGSCYCGYIEERNQSTHKRYIDGISQKSVLVITKV